MVFKRNGEIVLRKKWKSYFLIDIADNYMDDQCALFEINETGRFLWNHIDGRRSIQDLSVMLSNEIIEDIPFEVIFEDVETFMMKLKGKGFIEEV